MCSDVKSNGRIFGNAELPMQLARLKRKSLLESIGDGSRGSIRMHDLWRAFCIAETKRGELRDRQWVYEIKTCSGSSPCESSPSGNCWGNVKRMAFLDFEPSSLGRVNYAHFPNVTVLTIKDRTYWEEKLVVDLSGLVRLRGLEILGGPSLLVPRLSRLSVQGLPRSLIYLRLREAYADSGSEEPIVEQIGGLKELQWLELIGYEGGKLPDMRNMISLRQAIFLDCPNVVTVIGLSLTLRVLAFEQCGKLRCCPGVGDLVSLEMLSCNACWRLESLPNLGRLRKLRKLDICGCRSITELPGLGDLVALEELHTPLCKELSKLPDMRKLVNLRVLDLRYCSSIIEVPGFDSLVSLQKVEADFTSVVDKPSLRQLTKLQSVDIYGWSAAGIQGLNELTMLHTLRIGHCSGVDELPDLQSLTRLQLVTISESEFKDLSGLSNLIALETLQIFQCRKLERLPAWQRLTSLKSLQISDCAGLRRWDCTSVEQVEDTSVLDVDVSDSHMESKLETLKLSICGLSDLRSIGCFILLQRLEIAALPVTELPDLSNFPRLKYLRLWGCERLGRLMNRVPMNALSELEIDGCSSLGTIPDLCKSLPGLSTFTLERCDGVTLVSSSGPLTALTVFRVKSCNTLTAVPDLAMFPALERLHLNRCSELRALGSSVPLTALRDLEVYSCTTLTAVPDLAMFPALERLHLGGCSELRALSSSVPLTALQELEVRGCSRLSRDRVEQLGASCPRCETTYCEDEGVRPEDVGNQGSWRSRLLGLLRSRLLCAAIVLIGLANLAFRLSRDHVEQLGASCPQCATSIYCEDEDVRPEDVGVRGNWGSRLLGLCAAIVMIGLANLAYRRRGRSALLTGLHLHLLQ